MTIRCNRCQSKVTLSDIEWYSYECNYCDESLYSFEVFNDWKYQEEISIIKHLKDVEKYNIN